MTQTTEICFLTVLEAEHPRSRCRPIQLTEENPSFFGLQTAIFLLCPHVTEREIAHKLSGVSSCKGDTPLQDCSQSCPTLCNPIDCSPLGSSVHGIFQARIPELVVISFSMGSSPPRDRTHVSCISCIVRQVLYHCATWEANTLSPNGG